MRKAAKFDEKPPLSLQSIADQKSPEQSDAKEWNLRLYVAGQTPRSIAAFANLKKICEEHLSGRYTIEIVDLLKHPQLAAGDQIVAVDHKDVHGMTYDQVRPLILGAKGNALAEGRVHVSYADVEKVIYPALRHRIILNFQAEAENVNADQILAEVIKKVPRA